MALGKAFLLFGPPGSGKGTQSQLLREKLGFSHLSTGDLLRKHLKNETELGKKARVYMDAGELVPDEVVIGMVQDSLSDFPDNKDFVLDGFPRTRDQAIALDALLNDLNTEVGTCMFLDVETDVLKQRLVGRRVCKSCSTSYHVDFAPSKQEKVCDICQGEVVQRRDDSEEVIMERLIQYEKKTAPLKEYYKQKGILVVLKGENKPDVVFQDVLKIVS